MALQLCVGLLLVFYSEQIGGKVLNTFVEDETIATTELRNFIYDPSSQRLYVGAINQIYQLSAKLVQLGALRTGPHEDHYACPYNPDEPCETARVLKDGMNHGLVLNPQKKLLIACMNLFAGSCEKINTVDFSAEGHVFLPVVPNDTSKPVVMFFGSGVESRDTLFVGASAGRYRSRRSGSFRGTLSGGSKSLVSGGRPWSWSRNRVGLLSARSLDTFQLLANQSEYSSSIDLLPSFQEWFNVQFIGGFSLNGIAYFFANHPNTLIRTEGESPRTYAHVMRVCENDNKFHSFIELKLSCRVNGIEYNHIQDLVLAPFRQAGQSNSKNSVFAIFTKGDESSDVDSAFCIYTMENIQAAFKKSIQQCFSGKIRTGPPYIVNSPSMCTPMHSSNINGEFCGNYGSNHPISSDEAVENSYGSLVPGEVATAIQVQTVNDIVVAYIGTNSGNLLKLKVPSLNPSSSSAVYGTIDLPPVGPIKDLIVGSNQNIYMLTSEKVYNLKTFACSKVTNCTICVTDPHCGWCMTNNKCTEKASCSAESWQSDVCPVVTEIQPRYLSVDEYKTKQITLTVNNLPDLRRIECLMDSPSVATQETVASVVKPSGNIVKTVTCFSFTKVPTLQGNQSHINSSISVLVDKTPWLSSTITVFNCGLIKNCGSCTSLPFSCSWCAEQHKCMMSSGSCPVGMTQSKKETCPGVESATNKLVVVSGQSREFSVNGMNILKKYESTLRCRYNVNGKYFFAQALVSSPLIQPITNRVGIKCKSVMLSYPEPQPSVIAPLDLVWVEGSTEHQLENPNGIHGLCQMEGCGDSSLISLTDEFAFTPVEVYKCQYLGPTCGQCLTVDVNYGCVWCNNVCGHSSECRGLERNNVCPDPKISIISPLGGPLTGKTVLTVNGTNLGKLASELQVTVAGKDCSVQQDGFVPSTSFQCITSSSNAPGSGRVIVTVASQYTATSASNFEYKDPTLTSVIPKKALCFDGMPVTISGTNLHYGSNVEVAVNDKTAKIVQRNATHLVFHIPSNVHKGNVYLKVKFDQGNFINMKEKFECLEDPVLTSIEPRISLLSGGSNIIVKSKTLAGVVKPQLIVYIDDGNRTGTCNISSTATSMTCKTPDLRDVMFENGMSLDFGFIMGNVTNLLRLQKPGSKIRRPLVYYPLLSIKPLPGSIYYHKDLIVNLEGKNIAILREFKDLEISVGGTRCILAEIEDDTLEDQLSFIPAEHPAKEDRNERALVTVKVGNFYQEVGFIVYNHEGHKADVGLILGLLFGLIILVVIVIIVLVFVLRRRRQISNRNKKTLPKLCDLEGRKDRKMSNPYAESNPTAAEMVPLRDKLNIDDENYFQNLLKRIENPRTRSGAEEVFIARERLELGLLVGKGHFGSVFAATLKDDDMKGGIPVAVKTIEDPDLNQTAVENFLKEGIMMKKFDHPHVLGLYGLCLGYKKEPMVILPFMANGDLRTYIKDSNRNFTARQLLSLVQQVAEGMAYLSSLNFIHRDLASRNCMIDDKNQVKVADFGLSHELHDREYYSTKDHKAKLPIKWMALESLENFVFTTKSDVWSFGVLMWEVMTRGVTPYPDVEVFETRNYLASGRRLRKPKFCPDNVYKIMMSCWDELPDRRPNFAALVNSLELLLNPPRNKESSDPNEITYTNVVNPAMGSQDYLNPQVMNTSISEV